MLKGFAEMKGVEELSVSATSPTEFPCCFNSDSPDPDAHRGNILSASCRYSVKQTTQPGLATGDRGSHISYAQRCCRLACKVAINFSICRRCDLFYRLRA